eukprot:gene709-771_t
MEKVYLGNIEQSELNNKTVLVRVDYNVILATNTNDSIEVVNDARIRDSLETIRYLADANAKIILCSHLGRPEGKYNAKYSLKPVANRIKELLEDIPFDFIEECIGKEVEEAKRKLLPGHILLLENLRFHAEEEQNEPNFAAELCSLVDIYINEAFSASHRAHASTYGVAQFVEKRIAGFSLHKELRFLCSIIERPIRPVAAVIGGLKISTKIGVINNLIGKVDKILIGGAMSFTFYKALGYEVGDSVYEESEIEVAKEILRRTTEAHMVFRFGSDITMIPTRAFKAKISNQTNVDFEYCSRNIKIDEIPPHWTGVDIGPETIRDMSIELESCKTVFINGPMGLFELPEFSHGTHELFKMVERLTSHGAKTIICGGETVAAAERLKCQNFSHVSMGGGASLELLSGEKLPGVGILNEAENA